MQQVYRVADIKGLTPAVEPTRSGEQFVLDGRNYIFDSLGPKSSFGNRFLLPHKIEKPEHVQAIRLKLRAGDRVFTITNQAIMEWSEELGGWRILYVTPDTSATPYRWTHGFLSGAMYFCHPRVGILFYSLELDIMGLVETPGSPQDAVAIVVNNGRLCAVTPEFLMWSAPSDGTNWIPQLGGAGFQKLAARVPGYPTMITSYTAGVLVWTTGGVLRSEFSGDQEVYRHRALNTEYRPINSFCTFQADDNTVVILDERGLFQSKGEAPSPYAPMFNEFLIDFLQRNQLNLGQNVRLEWDDLSRLLYLSYSMSQYDPLYEDAFVLYPPMDKWGQFNEPHYGILPVRINTSERADDFYGFVDGEGRHKYWLPTGSTQIAYATSLLNLYYPTIQIPFHNIDGDEGRVLASVTHFNTYNDIVTTQTAGYYEDEGETPAVPLVTGLNAFVRFGLFRNSEDMAHDEASEILQVLVRSALTGEKNRLGSDFNLTPPVQPNVDFTTPGIDVTYGIEEINYVNHGLKMIGTNDGVTEYQSQFPDIVATSQAARHYSCSVVGIWHIIEITAFELSEAFHLRTLELTATKAGRIL